MYFNAECSKLLARRCHHVSSPTNFIFPFPAIAYQSPLVSKPTLLSQSLPLLFTEFIALYFSCSPISLACREDGDANETKIIAGMLSLVNCDYAADVIVTCHPGSAPGGVRALAAPEVSKKCAVFGFHAAGWSSNPKEPLDTE
ncbi:hypothetical protein CDAR_225181 [Caerostris darwini]|uniref:Uncharacterized protein n=1 Tax=Caerostris darwini TaxID=1538125 RepID=A0AAV4SLC5_9ARAC|nr:hypothetical protein CDAR_225181 [Caerostris darwini]